MALIKGKNKAKITAAILLVVSFLFSEIKPASALLNSYNKPWNGTLSATEWNNLPLDFLNKDGAATLMGPVTIGSASTSSSLFIYGPVLSPVGAPFISSGEFGSNASYGDFYFGASGPGNVGIGTTTASHKLTVQGDINFTGSLLNNGSPFTGSKWTQNGTSIFYDAGNVGIGTSEPLASLDIKGVGTSSATFAFNVQDSLGANKFRIQNNGQALVSNIAVTNLAEFGFLNDTNTGLDWITTDTVGLMAGGASRFSCSGTACTAAVPTTLTRLTTTLDASIGTLLSAGRIGATSLILGGDPANNSLAALEAYGGVSAYTSPSGASIFYDTFSGGVTEQLPVHTPDTGTSWTMIIQNGASTASSRNTGFAGPTATVTDGGVLYTADANYTTADYEVSTYIQALTSSDDVLNLAVRIQDTDNMYVARVSSSVTGIYRKVGGTWTLLGSATTYITAGNYVKLRVVGNVLSLYRGDSLLLTVSDSNITGAGKAGLGFGDVGIITTDDHDVTWQVDNFSVKLYEDANLAALFMNGNVGIGLTNPAARLHIAPGANAGFINTGSTQLTALGGAGSVFVMADNDGNIFSSSTSAIITPIVTPIITTAGGWTASGTLVYKTDPNGNVGIGTTNPAGKLDVSAGLASQTAGDLVVDTAVKTVYVGNLDSNSGNTTFIFRDRLGNQKMKLFNAGSGSFFMGNFGNNYGLQIQSSSLNSILASATTSARLVVDSGSSSFPAANFLSGNVGIGTTNPGATLDVVKAVGANGVWANFGYDGTNPSRAKIYASNWYGGFSLYDNANNETIKLNTGGNSWIATTGNVGIGTTTPATKLDVIGGGSFRNDGATTHTLLGGSGNVLVMADNTGTLYSSSTSAIITPIVTPIVTTAGGWTASGTLVYKTDNNGNVGIGVTNPQEKLEVSGGSIRINSGDSWKSAIIKDGNGATIFRGLRGNPYWSDNPANSVGFNVGSSGDNIVFTTANSIIAPRMMAHTSGFQVNGGAYNLASAPAGLFEVTNGATKLFDILSNGRVGISTTSPAAKLQIVASPDPGFINSGSTQLSALGGAGNVLVAADNTGTLYSTGLSVGGYWTANGNHIYNNNSANVGIGATNPVQKLEVANGNIKLSANSYIQGNSAGGTGNGGYVMFTGEAGANAGYGVWLNQNAIWNGTNWLQPRGTLGSLMFTSNHHLGWSWRFAGAGGADGGNITPNEVANLNSSGRLQIDGVLNVDGTASSYIQGRVGITTTTPAAKLQIVASPDPGFINSGSTQLSALGGAGNVLVAADNTGTLYSTGLSVGGYWTANGNHIYNNNSANVGVGTTTPTAKLEVFGDIKSSVVGSSAVFTAYNPGTNYPRALFKVGNSTSDINTGLMFAPEYTSAGITKPFSLEIYNNKFNADSSARMVGLGVYATYSSIHSLGPNGNSAGLPLIFSTQTYSGNNPAIYISNAAAQNVGIGTSTPANKLVVSNNGASYIQISGSGGAGAQSGIKLTSNYGVTANSELNFDYFGSYASSTTGSVGHGVNLISGRAAPFGNFWFRNSTNNVGAAFVDPSYPGSNMGTFASMNLLVGGKVGISTTTPASKLQIVAGSDPGFINTGVNQLSALANSGNVLVMADNNGVLYATSTAGFLGGSTSGSDYWALAGSSLTASSTTWNVGIGTTNPGAKLTLGNDQWFGAINAAGTATANMFKLNTNNQIEVGSPLLIGPLELAQDGGYLTFIDMSVTSAAASSTVQGYSLRLDGNSLLNLYSRSNGTGGVADLGVGIGITNPSAALHVVGSTALIVNGAIQFASLGNSGQVFLMADNDGNLYATSSPTQLTGSYLPLTGGTLTGDLNMSGNDIDAVNKLTVNTIDPLYKIKGINYSTFVASVVGGVKEEYIGRAELKKVNANGEYEQVIDFTKQKEGSDLWVWRKVVDFSRDNVDVLMTAYGRFAQVYYLIDGEKLIFRSDKPTVVSYRLVGQRIDWRSWPTRAIDQQETPGFIID